MKIKTPYYYKNFKCIAAKCSDTCCAGWEIIIDNTTYDKYKNVNNSFGKRLKSEIIKYDDNEPGFKLKNNRCAFLNNNLLCDIYSNLGEEYLCHTCKTFPRIIEEYGNLREISLSMSCPEAARLILKDSKNLSFDITETEEFVSTYNTIPAELYIQILGSREIAFNIIANKNLSFNKRISVLLHFAAEIQKNIDACEISKISEIRKKYTDENFYNSLSFNNYENHEKIKYTLTKKYINQLKDLEEINSNWSDLINNALNVFYNKNDFSFYKKHHEKFNEYYKDKLYEYENIFSYFIFRYYMKSLYDADLLSKIKLSIFSIVIIKELNVIHFANNNYKFTLNDQINISHMYSKDIEHSDNNIEKLYTIFNENEIFNNDNFQYILNN